MFTTHNEAFAEKCLLIKRIEKTYSDDKVILEFELDNGSKTEILWYSVDSQFEQYLCDDRCDGVVVSLFLAAMKYGYHSIKSNYPISRKLYYNLTYHVIPQLYLAGGKRLPRIKIDTPLTDVTYNGSLVVTGMSRGVDSFSTMYEYGKQFELEEYRINAFTYFQAGAHHGWDAKMGRSEETKQELYVNQMNKTKEFCAKYGYPLIVVDSNIDNILLNSGMFKEWSFDRTHTVRNLGIVMLLQKGISRYYYSSAYSLNAFKLTIDADMAHYEKWLIPHLCTESVEFYQSNQDWSRMDKVAKISQLEESYDYLQVCLVKSKNCGCCVKCKRTLIELDALGEETLEKYKNSFDIETYKREHRQEWFESILTEKEKSTSEAQFLDEAFVYAVKYHPELIGDLVKEKREDVKLVRLTDNGINIRDLPSLKSNVLFVGKKNETYEYCGDCGSWACIRIKDGETAFVVKRFVEYMS